MPKQISVPALTSIGGSIEIEVSTQTNIQSLEFSALTTVGGKLSIINRNLGASTGISSWNFDNLESAGVSLTVQPHRDDRFFDIQKGHPEPERDDMGDKARRLRPDLSGYAGWKIHSGRQ